MSEVFAAPRARAAQGAARATAGYSTVSAGVAAARRVRSGLRKAVLALGFIGLAATPALAVEPDEAQSLVEATANEIISAASAGSVSDKSKALQRILQRRADVNRISRYTVGRKWNQMSSSQRSRYTAAIIPYISSRFAKGFNDFRGGSLDVKSAVKVKRGKEIRVVVRSIGRRGNGGSATDIEWEIADRGGRAVVLDVKIENLSLVIQQRQEINSLLASVGGNFDKLIAKLQEAASRV